MTTTAGLFHKNENLFLGEKKKDNLPITQPTLQFNGIDLEKPAAEERYGCHSKKFMF